MDCYGLLWIAMDCYGLLWIAWGAEHPTGSFSSPMTLLVDTNGSCVIARAEWWHAVQVAGAGADRVHVECCRFL